ncbi:hypothetical protein KHA80_11570 [Anaerobacillus sp. HL2]|nr:hypothetical protein KHA80_11570 [Anaerobacillus sp. HL2]
MKLKRQKAFSYVLSDARRIQQRRYTDTSIACNAELTPTLIRKYCQLDYEVEDLLKKAYEHYNIVVRHFTNLLK